jgi:hypothetical protein
MSESKSKTDPEAKREPNKWDCPGIYCIGDRVIWDGEADYLGTEPFTFYPEPEDLEDIDYPDETDAKTPTPTR